MRRTLEWKMPAGSGHDKEDGGFLIYSCLSSSINSGSICSSLPSVISVVITFNTFMINEGDEIKWTMGIS